MDWRGRERRINERELIRRGMQEGIYRTVEAS
jgi:hypothetical protein